MRDFCLDNLDVSVDQGILDTHKGSFGHLLIASGDTGYGCLLYTSDAADE